MINIHNKSPKILVIGDLIIDHYLWGTSERISPEAPVPVINVKNESIILGGAANVINNLKSLGAKVDVLSVLGECEVSTEVVKLLENIKIDTKNLIIQKGRVTSKKSRIIASQQQIVRFDREIIDEINMESQDQIVEKYLEIADNYDCILLSDYGKGVLTYNLTQSIIKFANKHNIKVLVDPKGLDYSKYKGSYLLTPNKKEASEATQINIKGENSLIEALLKLKSEYDLNVSLITLGEGGMAIYDHEFKKYPTIAREVFDVTGAGDTVLAALGFALACEIKIEEAIKFSNLAASVVIGKIGSATATLNEIIEYESSINKSSSDKHIKTQLEITSVCNDLRSRGKKIVFTNGCFDILHMGHVKYLEASKEFGDVLIVGLNSNRSVAALKGANRPINDELDRAYILAALEVVDYVVIFNNDTPYELIKAAQPNTLVKGGDYEGKSVIGEDIVDELKIVEFINGKSTSTLIKNIKKR
jgi:D-beta-D-heptose 7-phosphate kinase/D-beta-D-heptose 1-phosphate adenosyltransferase